MSIFCIIVKFFSLSDQNFPLLWTDSKKQIYNKSYQVLKGAKNRTDAITACEKYDRKLFEPKNAIENVDVLNILKNASISSFVWNYLEFCFNGIVSNNVCCDQSCGQCGGTGCDNLPGGSSKCCRGTITNSGIICQTTSDTGCIISGKFSFCFFQLLLLVMDWLQFLSIILPVFTYVLQVGKKLESQHDLYTILLLCNPFS